MYGFRINKGLDRPPEVLGIRGMNYLMYLGGGVVGGLLVTAILVVVTGVSAMYGFIIFIALCFVLFHYLVGHSRKYGERGHARTQAQNRMPQVILVRDTKFLTDMRRQSRRSTQTVMTKFYNRILTIKHNGHD